MNIRLESNAADLNRAIGAYIVASGKTVDEVLQKQGAKLGWAINKQLKGLAPRKGQVTDERMAAMERGGKGNGVRVHKRTRMQIYQKYGVASDIASQGEVVRRGKKMVASYMRTKTKKVNGEKIKRRTRVNVQNLLVERELASRESGRLFTSVGSLFPKSKITHAIDVKNGAGKKLAEAGVSFGKNPRFLRFSWAKFTNLAGRMAHSMTRPKALAAASRAMVAVTDDIMEYVLDHMSKDALRILGKALR